MNTNELEMIAPAAKRRATGRWALAEHRRRLRENAELFVSLAREAGILTEDSAGAPMIACLVGSSTEVLQLSAALMRRGVNADPIVSPVVPEGEARLRFFVTSCLSDDQIRSVVGALAEELALLNAGGRADGKMTRALSELPAAGRLW